MTSTEFYDLMRGIARDSFDHPSEPFEREEDARYIKCASEGGECDEEVENEGDLCPGCLALQVKEDAFQND